jgi:dipeptidyl aminopeptidase/acylaminoacyl peptidase
MERVDATGEIIWLTQRNGWKHLALHDRDGRFIRWLTGGAFVVDRILAIDQARKEIYFTAAGREPGENPHQIHTYRVATDGSGLIALDRGNAHHTVDSSSLSPSFSYLVDNHSRADLPSRSVLRDRTGRVVMSLEETDTSALSAAGWRAPTPFEVTAADGKTPLHGAMFKPSDFDPTRRYPMIVDVYPGPGANATFPLDFNPGEFENHAFPQALAERGFIVVQPSNRGSSTFRERRFALFGYGNPRDFPMADLRATVDQLTARHSFVDADRIGISGYSGGGLMSATAILTYPDLFKVAVAGAGNHDQNLYEQNSSEFHFGVPPVGMAASRTFFGTNAQIADRLQGRLLLIHSDQDRDVIIAHSLRLAAALRTAGKPYDMMILPGLSHAATFEDPAYFNAAADYFTRYLVASPEPAPGR